MKKGIPLLYFSFRRVRRKVPKVCNWQYERAYCLSYVYMKYSQIWINLSLVGQQVGTDNTHLKEGGAHIGRSINRQCQNVVGHVCRTCKSLEVCGAWLHIFGHEEATNREGSLKIHRKSGAKGGNMISYDAHDLA